MRSCRTRRASASARSRSSSSRSASPTPTAGREGKQRILTAYLNQNFYGNNSYGVKAAALSYFDVRDLSTLTIAQAATLAAIPQAPSTYDLVRNAVEDEDETSWSCRPTRPSCSGATSCFDLLADDPPGAPSPGDQYSRDQDFLAAMEEPLVLRPQRSCPGLASAPLRLVRPRGAAPSSSAATTETCDPLEARRLARHDDPRLEIQQSAEKWVEAAALVPHRANPGRGRQLGVPYAPGCSEPAEPERLERRRSPRSTTRAARSSPTSARPTTTSGARSARRCSRSSTC